MDVIKSTVYIKIDSANRILRCEGGYTALPDLTGWVEIDKGSGDKYNLCQSNYFDGGLYTDDGVCRWKYVDGQCTLRADAEIEADRQAQPEIMPPQASNLEQRVADCEADINQIVTGLEGIV